MADYDFRTIEHKWQARWQEAGVFNAFVNPQKKKFYVLGMFPYPSGGGLHMGHFRTYAVSDVYARFKRMQGFSVLYPTGFDAFGLPAENAAIKFGKHPKDWTFESIDTIRKQMLTMGLSYDWTRDLVTCTPGYYRWNQWLFLKLYERGLAYRKEAIVNWCKRCGTVLANEQVVAGGCWRCSTPVEARELKQWFLKITAYADELLNGLENLEWPERVKTMQKNWIGRSEGVLVKFQIKGTDDHIHVFTTRAETLAGCTFLALAPEHPKVLELVRGTRQEYAVKDFVTRALVKRIGHAETVKEGVPLGVYAINPATGEELPVFTANFVMLEYGTGAVMGVPAHDQRDFEFALAYGLPVKLVIKPKDHELKAELMMAAYEGDGVLVNSGEFNGLDSKEGAEKIVAWLESKGMAKKSVQYKLRDWLISRQRYWGTPIPIVYCQSCGTVPVPERDLPVLLPEDVAFTGEGNPLEKSPSFVNTRCPKCGNAAKRETDTMDTFVDSSWYFFRFASRPENRPFESDEVNYWMPVDAYIGGIEHAVLHLLYARFFTKATRDMGMHSVNEPFTRLFAHGMVTKGGNAMSKSRGNVVEPDAIVGQYGVDAARMYVLGVSMPDSDVEWSDRGVPTSFRFLTRLWHMSALVPSGSTVKNAYVKSAMNALVRDATAHMEEFNYPAALNCIEAFVDELDRYRAYVTVKTYKKALETVTLLLTPFAPHLCEELWSREHEGFANVAPWPRPGTIDEDVLLGEEIVKNVVRDVGEVKKLAKVAVPKKITLFVAPEWKRVVYNGVRDGRTVADFMKVAKLKKHGDDLVRYVQSLQKKKFELREHVLDAEDELVYIKKNKKYLEAVLGCRVSVEDASKSDHVKARAADVHKPGILLE